MLQNLQKIFKSDFRQMPWKNGRGLTSEIYIHPSGSTLAQNNFHYRLSSAPVDQEGEFSISPGKNRILTPIKGAGFQLNSAVYEKFEVAQFSGDEKVYCHLLKEPIVDFGVIYDPSKVSVQVRVLRLKSDLSFELELGREHLFTVLQGDLYCQGQQIKELETVRYHQEPHCALEVKKMAVVFYLSVRGLGRGYFDLINVWYLLFLFVWIIRFQFFYSHLSQFWLPKQGLKRIFFISETRILTGVLVQFWILTYAR